MEIEEFEELTGITLTESQQEDFESMYNRALKRLQKTLGWELFSSDNYEEAGQMLSYINGFDQRNFDRSRLEAPDPVNNTWRLYPYYDVLTNLRIDPCTAVYQAKLVLPLIGEETEFVTICNIESFVPLVGRSVGRDNYITYIKKMQEVNSCGCVQWVTSAPQLAVDAEWLARNYPEELREVLADMIIYAYQNQPSLIADSSRPVKSISQSVDGHSISKTYADADRLVSSYPLQNDETLNILKAYIGPYSPLYKERRIY